MGDSNILDEKTKLPLFVALSVLPALVGFVFWLTSLAVDLTHIQQRVEKLELRQDKQLEMLTQIHSDVLIIKEQLKQKRKLNGEY